MLGRMGHTWLLNILNLPVYGFLADGDKEIICLGKGFAAEEPPVGRIGAGMGGFYDIMMRVSNYCQFGLGMAAPEDKDHGVFPLI